MFLSISCQFNLAKLFQECNFARKENYTSFLTSIFEKWGQVFVYVFKKKIPYLEPTPCSSKLLQVTTDDVKLDSKQDSSVFSTTRRGECSISRKTFGFKGVTYSSTKTSPTNEWKD